MAYSSGNYLRGENKKNALLIGNVRKGPSLVAETKYSYPSEPAHQKGRYL